MMGVLRRQVLGVMRVMMGVNASAEGDGGGGGGVAEVRVGEEGREAVVVLGVEGVKRSGSRQRTVVGIVVAQRRWGLIGAICEEEEDEDEESGGRGGEGERWRWRI